MTSLQADDLHWLADDVGAVTEALIELSRKQPGQPAPMFARLMALKSARRARTALERRPPRTAAGRRP